MNNEENEFAPFQDLIGEGLPLLGFRVLTYLDKDGATRYKISHAGQAQLTELIGLLEIAKVELTLKTIQRNG